MSRRAYDPELSLKLYHVCDLRLGYQQSIAEAPVNCPSVPTESFPATLALELATLPPPARVKTIADDAGGGGFRQERTLPVGASKALHGFEPCFS